jgi:hypothetical protein
MRKVTSPSTSTKMPPSPNITTGPKTGSFCTPMIVRLDPVAQHRRNQHSLDPRQWNVRTDLGD